MPMGLATRLYRLMCSSRFATVRDSGESSLRDGCCAMIGDLLGPLLSLGLLPWHRATVVLLTLKAAAAGRGAGVRVVFASGAAGLLPWVGLQ
jgi:hypothetical protein